MTLIGCRENARQLHSRFFEKCLLKKWEKIAMAHRVLEFGESVKQCNACAVEAGVHRICHSPTNVLEKEPNNTAFGDELREC